jgi:hypothetical protein
VDGAYNDRNTYPSLRYVWPPLRPVAPTGRTVAGRQPSQPLGKACGRAAAAGQLPIWRNIAASMTAGPPFATQAGAPSSRQRSAPHRRRRDVQRLHRFRAGTSPTNRRRPDGRTGTATSDPSAFMVPKRLGKLPTIWLLDNRILECPVEVGSQYILSGDKDLLRLGEIRTTLGPVAPHSGDVAGSA